MTTKTAVGKMASTDKKESKKEGCLSSLRIEPAENGFTVSCSHKPHDGKEGMYMEPESYVFNSKADVLEFLDSALDG